MMRTVLLLSLLIFFFSLALCFFILFFLRIDFLLRRIRSLRFVFFSFKCVIKLALHVHIFYFILYRSIQSIQQETKQKIRRRLMLMPYSSSVRLCIDSSHSFSSSLRFIVSVCIRLWKCSRYTKKEEGKKIAV